MNKKVIWITRTAVLIALLVVLQMATSLLGNQLATGSIVNMMLVVSVMTSGLPTGLTVAAFSPVMAKLLGIGPFWSLIPFIALGNITLVLLWHIIGNRKIVNKYIAQIAALITAAVAKFLVIYISIVRIAIPVILNLPEPQASVISGVFSTQQLITAAIGGAIAIVLLTTINKGIRAGARN